jgi:G:T/U-mismatch repair DNA glycosylase
MSENNPIETHPWQPWTPTGAKILFLGTFPPGTHRWAMDFYYPNPTNDFWQIMGLLLLGDKQALYDVATKKYDLDGIKALTIKYGIALSDTAVKIRRLAGNASDKFLEIVEPRQIAALLSELPCCTDVVTTGEKASSVAAEQANTLLPAMGEFVEWKLNGDRSIRLWRMPSTSRAYPLKLEKKAEFYAKVLKIAGAMD